MEHVEKLLNDRMAAAKFELCYCEDNNPYFAKARTKLNEEIKQLEQALLILLNVIHCPCCIGTDIVEGDEGYGENFCTNCGEYF